MKCHKLYPEPELLQPPSVYHSKCYFSFIVYVVFLRTEGWKRSWFKIREYGLVFKICIITLNQIVVKDSSQILHTFSLVMVILHLFQNSQPPQLLDIATQFSCLFLIQKIIHLTENSHFGSQYNIFFGHGSFNWGRFISQNQSVQWAQFQTWTQQMIHLHHEELESFHWLVSVFQRTLHFELHSNKHCIITFTVNQSVTMEFCKSGKSLSKEYNKGC